MYVELSKKADTPELKTIFQRLAQQELLHAELFRKQSMKILKAINKTELNNLYLLKNIDNKKLSLETMDEINQALDLAINEEQRAYEDYQTLLKHLNFGEVRETFEEVARQELRHKQMLQKVKLELNNNDWSVL
jgi:rubrerythrin